MLRLVRSVSLLAAILAAASLGAAEARAGLLPNLKPVTPSGGFFKFSYDVDVAAKAQINPGDSFTIYDFAGFLPGSEAMPAGWTFSSSLLGPTPAQALPIDDPGVENLTFTYAGPDPIVGPINIGDFSADSIYGGVGTADFTSSTHRDTGAVVTTITTVGVPGDVPPAPEPKTVAMFGLSLPLLALLRFLRRRRKTAG